MCLDGKRKHSAPPSTVLLISSCMGIWFLTVLHELCHILKRFMSCLYDLLCPALWWWGVNKHVIFTFVSYLASTLLFVTVEKIRIVEWKLVELDFYSLIAVAVAFILNIGHQLCVFCRLWSDLQTFTIDPQHHRGCVVSLLSLCCVHVDSFLCLAY